MISTLLKQSKKNYNGKYFKDNINNMKNTWEGIRSIISLQKTTNDSPTIISLEGQPLLIREQLQTLLIVSSAL